MTVLLLLLGVNLWASGVFERPTLKDFNIFSYKFWFAPIEREPSERNPFHYDQ